MYGPERILELQEKPVSFGASEILMDAMNEGLVDAAVVVCEGAGTVVAARPDVLQAIGAHMTGLIKTEPIAEIQDGLAKRGCLLLDRQATVDQVRGYEKAVAAGFQKIAVTIAGTNADEATALREMGAKLGQGPFCWRSTPPASARHRPASWRRAAIWSGPVLQRRCGMSWEEDPGCRWASPFPSLPSRMRESGCF